MIYNQYAQRTLPDLKNCTIYYSDGIKTFFDSVSYENIVNFYQKHEKLPLKITDLDNK